MYRFFIPFEYARRRALPTDVAVEPFPTTLGEIVEASKCFYSLWYSLDWAGRETKRWGRIPYRSSYGEGKKEGEEDMELWVVVGSPTRGIILVEIDPKTGSFMGETNFFTKPIWVIDLSDGRAVWFLLWNRGELPNIAEIKAPRVKPWKPKPSEHIILEVKEGVKNLVIIERRSKSRVDLFYTFDYESTYTLSDNGFKELLNISDWIFKETEKRYGKRWMRSIDVSCSTSHINLRNLPKDLFKETIEKLRKLAERELVVS